MAKVMLKNVRLSFPCLWNAEQFEGTGPFKYRASFLFEPNSENHKALVKAMKEVAAETWKKDADKVLANANEDSKTRFIGKGDSKEYDGYAGMLFVSATRNQDKGRALVMDKDKSPLGETDGKPYGGCYVNAQIDLWAQDNRYGKTIRAQLLAVQFYKDGDAFGSGSSIATGDEFEDLSDSGDDSLVA